MLEKFYLQFLQKTSQALSTALFFLCGLCTVLAAGSLWPYLKDLPKLVQQAMEHFSGLF